MEADAKSSPEAGQVIDTEELQERLPRVFRYIQLGCCINGVTHDVNNYLGAMLAYAELVSLDNGIEDESRRMISEIMEGVTKCSQLINGLTDIARKERPNTSMVDVGETVKRVIKLRTYALRVDQVNLEPLLPPNMPSLVADAPKLQLAILYLMMNAQEAVLESPRKLVRIKLADTGEGLSLTFWNSGPPVPEEQREAIFAPYFTTKTEHHLGLGLTAARNIAELHDGTLTYDSEKGFVLYLPRESRIAESF